MPPSEPALWKLGSPGMLFVLPEVLTQVLIVCSIFEGFSLLFLLAIAIPFSYSNYLTVSIMKKRWKLEWIHKSFCYF